MEECLKTALIRFRFGAGLTFTVKANCMSLTHEWEYEAFVAAKRSYVPIIRGFRRLIISTFICCDDLVG